MALFMHMLVFLKCIAKDKLGNSKKYIFIIIHTSVYTYICSTLYDTIDKK